MKVAILAGGRGTRLAEETEVRPKPMVEIGGYPILWHIMRHFDRYDHRHFVLALGYKSSFIKRYFAEHRGSARSMKVHLRSGEVEWYDDGFTEDWTVDLIETGRWTNTGGRIKRLAEYLGDETFFLTYGDGVADVDLDALLAFHRSHNRLATVTAVHPPPRFGRLVLEGGRVTEFSEKPIDAAWVNGAFFVCEPGVFDYVASDETQWEKEPMEQLAADDQLMAFPHEGFWQPMDTIRDRSHLRHLWDSGNAPWKTWD